MGYHYPGDSIEDNHDAFSASIEMAAEHPSLATHVKMHLSSAIAAEARKNLGDILETQILATGMNISSLKKPPPNTSHAQHLLLRPMIGVGDWSTADGFATATNNSFNHLATSPLCLSPSLSQLGFDLHAAQTSQRYCPSAGFSWGLAPKR